MVSPHWKKKNRKKKKKKRKKFYLHENVQLINFVYSKKTCIHGAELADGDIIFLFLLERIWKVQTCVNMFAIPFINCFNYLETSVPAGQER